MPLGVRHCRTFEGPKTRPSWKFSNCKDPLASKPLQMASLDGMSIINEYLLDLYWLRLKWILLRGGLWSTWGNGSRFRLLVLPFLAPSLPLSPILIIWLCLAQSTPWVLHCELVPHFTRWSVTNWRIYCSPSFPHTKPWRQLVFRIFAKWGPLGSPVRYFRMLSLTTE